ncbi:hypothetical protein Pelo_4130 [Pelomyxa schiedti]|nr:hypothetical protein Pelo_4130 [Pelomyxa schiedti]
MGILRTQYCPSLLGVPGAGKTVGGCPAFSTGPRPRAREVPGLVITPLRSGTQSPQCLCTAGRPAAVPLSSPCGAVDLPRTFGGGTYRHVLSRGAEAAASANPPPEAQSVVPLPRGTQPAVPAPPSAPRVGPSLAPLVVAPSLLPRPLAIWPSSRQASRVVPPSSLLPLRSVTLLSPTPAVTAGASFPPASSPPSPLWSPARCQAAIRGFVIVLILLRARKNARRAAAAQQRVYEDEDGEDVTDWQNCQGFQTYPGGMQGLVWAGNPGDVGACVNAKLVFEYILLREVSFGFDYSLDRAI